jgi:type II secretory pathway component PulF
MRPSFGTTTNKAKQNLSMRIFQIFSNQKNFAQIILNLPIFSNFFQIFRSFTIASEKGHLIGNGIFSRSLAFIVFELKRAQNI